MENWKAIYLFLLKKKKSLNTNTQGELRIFFLQWVCFSKVNLEVLPIWLRKTKAPVNASTLLLWLGKLPHLQMLQEVADVFPGSHCLLLLLQRRKTGWWVRFYLSCRMTHSARVSDPRILLLLCSIHPHSPTPPLFFLVLGRAVFHLPSPATFSLESQKNNKFFFFFFQVKLPTIAFNLLWELI